MSFVNTYENRERALSYSKIDFTGTYYLAFRDLPQLINSYIKGKYAIDFGCGTGRSSRFLKSLGFETVGLDIAAEMLKIAREIDPNGKYVEIEDGNLDKIPNNSFDIVFSAFTFDNVPTKRKKVQLFNEFRRVLKPDGIVVNLVSSPELYTNDWLSFKTTCFTHNFFAKSGDKVNTIIVDGGDSRPVEDELCTELDYREIYASAGFEILHIHKPLGNQTDPFIWLNEAQIPPWTIYVLRW